MITFELLSPGKYLPATYWTDLMPTISRVEIELGPGDGGFLVASARRHPDTLFVGLEIRQSLARAVAADPEVPSNVRIHHVDGRFVVCHLLADASIDAFHVYFPDPWWKKRHHKRRLFTEEFAAALRRCLKAGAKVFVITDVEPLFDDIGRRLECAGLTREEWSRSADEPCQSSYERKYRRQGRRLLEAAFVK